MKKHKHRWILETPNGPLAKARCSGCKAVSQFPNSDIRTSWDNYQKNLELKKIYKEMRNVEQD